jgi:uncharacterized protein (DUF697 family)
MAWRAHVYLERPPSRGLDDIGTILLDGPSTQSSHVRLAVNGKAELGVVERIDPADWQDQFDGVLPKVHISLARQADERSLIRKWLEDSKKYYTELGGWKTFRSGEWLWAIIEKSFTNYWERATAEYFYAKYPDLGVDEIAKKLIAVAAKNAAVLGGIAGGAVSTDAVVGLLTGFEGGVGLPANIAIAGASISAEVIQLVRIQLQLVANLGKLYGARLDPDDPEDILTILAFALGGAAADAAGKAGMKMGGRVAGLGAKKIFAKDVLATLKRVAAKVGVKILQRSVVKYTVPVVSIGIGSSWNYLATKNVGRIAAKHFKRRAAAGSSP